MNSMRLLVIHPLWPHPSHSPRAANIVLYELLSAFADTPGMSVGFLKICQPGEAEETPQELEGKRSLEKKGVIFPPLFIISVHSVRPKFRKIIFPSLEDFYPGVNGYEKKRFFEAVRSFSPDVIFIPWSEWATALAADLPYPKYAYYGNPDPKSALARLHFDRRHRAIGTFEFLAKTRMAANLETIHMDIMRRYEMIGDVAANDAEYYRSHGLSQAHYIQNVWFDRYPNWQELRVSREQISPLKIVGSIGKLSGTANTHGFEILAAHILPELRKIMKARPFEIHIFGAGDPHPAIAPLLRAPEIKLRGFVEDIDAELLSAPIFLCVNNGSEYKVGHTRYLHAWSLGSCVIAHRDAIISMPEIRHRENTLLGDNATMIAALVAVAGSDKKLRESIAEGGYRTFQEHFRAKNVVPKILEKITHLV